jgi:hypothetical protein
MVQLVISDFCVTRRHGLDALAVAGTDQARHVGWAHASSRLAAERFEERR